MKVAFVTPELQSLVRRTNLAEISRLSGTMLPALRNPHYEWLGEDLVLLRCSMSIAGQGSGHPGGRRTIGVRGVTAADRARTVELTGLAPTQADVSGFLLRMERTPLVRDVRLLDTRRQPVLDRTVVLFRVDLRLDPGRKEAS